MCARYFSLKFQCLLSCDFSVLPICHEYDKMLENNKFLS